MADREGARKTPEAMILSTCPDVCKTPMGSSLVPVPYPIVTYCSMATGEAQTVNMTGCKVVTKATKISCVYGDEPGVGGGVKSGVNKAMVEFISASTSVYCEGNPVIRHLDDAKMNNGNTFGKVQYPIVSMAGPAPKIDEKGEFSRKPAGPVFTPETHAEAAAAAAGRGFWGRVGGFFKGAGEALYEAGAGIAQVVAHPIDTATNLANADLGQLWDGATQGYRDAIAAGNYEEAYGRAAVDIGSMFIGGAGAAGKVGTAGKVAGAAARAGEAAAAAGKIGEAASVAGRVGEVAAVAGKAGDVASATGKAAEVASAAGKAAEAAAIAEKTGNAASITGRTGEAAKTAQTAVVGAGDGVQIAKRAKSLREQYLGRTPGKQSRTGREVQKRMRAEGKLRENALTGKTEFQDSKGYWHDISKADMAHKTDGVRWWNETGREFGAKSSEVRTWMRDAENYTLDHFSLNRSAGAKIGKTYLPPLK